MILEVIVIIIIGAFLVWAYPSYALYVRKYLLQRNSQKVSKYPPRITQQTKKNAQIAKLVAQKPPNNLGKVITYKGTRGQWREPFSNESEHRLIDLLGQDKAYRLIAGVQLNHPQKPYWWCADKALKDFFRDRNA